MDKRQKIEWITMFIVLGFSALLLSCLIHVYTGHPQTVFFYLFSGEPPLFIFRDFETVYSYTKGNDPYNPALGVTNYFPLAYVYAKIFNFMPIRASLFTYLGLVLIALCYYTYANVRTGQYAADLRNTFILVFLSYPGFFSIQRLNHDVAVMLITGLFVYLYNYKKWWVAPLILSIVIAMKVYPAAFLVLFLADRRYKEIALAIFSTLALTILSYMTLHGGLVQNIQGNLLGLEAYNNGYAIGEAGLGYCHTIYGAIKVMYAKLNPSLYRAFVPNLFYAMPYISFSVFGIIVLYITFVEKLFWKKVALLVFVVCVLPHVSADYKLLFVFIPVFLFINAEKNSSTDYLYVVIFSLLLVPLGLQYLTFADETGIPSYLVSTSVFATPLVLLAGMLAIMLEGLYQTYCKKSR